MSNVEVSQKKITPRDWIIFATIVIVGSALRIYHFDFQALWIDEISSLRNALAFGKGGLDLLATVDQVAPLHSIILWVSVLLGGETALASRAPSIIAGILTIVAIFFATRRILGSSTTALVSAALVAISPYAIWYSQEGRMYAVLLLGAVAYVFFSWPVTQRPLKLWELVVVTVVSALSLLTHHYMLLLMGAFGLFLILRGGLLQSRAWLWAATQVLAVLPFCYWMLLTINKMGNPAGTEKPAFLLWVPYTLYTFVVGFSFGPTATDLRFGHVQTALLQHGLAILAAAAGTAVLLLCGLVTLRRSRNWLGLSWLLMWLAVPIGLAIFATLVTKIQFHPRYVIVSYPPLIIILAAAISGLLDRIAGRAGNDATPATSSGWIVRAGVLGAVVLLAVCTAISMSNLYTSPLYAKEDPRELASLVVNRNPDTLVISNNYHVAKPLTYYTKQSWMQVIGPDKVVEQKRTPDMIIAEVKPLLTSACHEIMLIQYRSWESDPADKIRTWLDDTQQLEKTYEWPGVALRMYRVKDEGGPTAATTPATETKPCMAAKPPMTIEIKHVANSGE